ncbi:hypothetical protein GCM10010840_28990 [Deinococcus aerolatus]|uniref:Uncharacterized protein n=1 Tax=Deinococcus aerolatus TaxID=522487 RepID=A0ABQ2GDR7_9DEIO|nr:hypothetical protein [Deinococcus aerolatus]GGL89092.1 hypothetical protein GCM10010840_28990 [Deinococcus aerolatus]
MSFDQVGRKLAWKDAFVFEIEGCKVVGRCGCVLPVRQAFPVLNGAVKRQQCPDVGVSEVSGNNLECNAAFPPHGGQCPAQRLNRQGPDWFNRVQRLLRLDAGAACRRLLAGALAPLSAAP